MKQEVEVVLNLTVDINKSKSDIKAFFEEMEHVYTMQASVTNRMEFNNIDIVSVRDEAEIYKVKQPSIHDKIAAQLDKCKDIKTNYYIGTDMTDENMFVYCLARTVGDSTEIILLKRVRDKDKFTQEVENLSKYFNAEIILK